MSSFNFALQLLIAASPTGANIFGVSNEMLRSMHSVSYPQSSPTLRKAQPN